MNDNDAVFKALADPTRRLILDEFAERSEQTLFELCGRLVMKHGVSLTRQAIAKHIATLETAGIIQSERRGKYRLLVFDPEPIAQLTARWLPTSLLIRSKNKL